MSAQEEFDRTLVESARPLVVLAHQDDELGCTGILQRTGGKLSVAFMTNGDGLAPSVGEDPQAYAALRTSEAVQSLRVAGVLQESIRFLGHSEIEIYRHMARLRGFPAGLSKVMEFFTPIQRSIAELVNGVQPDAVYTVAYQGGHPEHDLAHFFLALALRTFERANKCKVPLYHFPEYELTILIPMRFRPWYPGRKLWVELTQGEMERKRQMVECYPSQKKLVRKFELVVSGLTLPQRVLLRRDPMDRFFGREQVSPVPCAFNYRRSPYRIDLLNYLFEDFEHTPITFRDCIRPLVIGFEDACK